MSTTKTPLPADRLHECRACGRMFVGGYDKARKRYTLPDNAVPGIKYRGLCLRDHYRVRRHGAPITTRVRVGALVEDLDELLRQGYAWDRAVDRLAEAKGVQRDSVLTQLRRARRRGIELPEAVAA